LADSELRRGLTSDRETPAKRGRTRVRRIGPRRVIAEGLEAHRWSDFYYDAMTVSWPAFLGVLGVAFVALNALFALVYLVGDAPIANARPGSFADAFFFSVETTSTVGYGDMHPQTTYGHIVATFENFVGLVSLAMMTGVVFARFSRPRARVIFARHPVICVHDGEPTLAIRIANARNGFITEANAKLWLIGPTVSGEGRRRVSFEPVKLTKSENPTFALTWTLYHPVDAESPLAGVGSDELVGGEFNLVVTISGHDETSSQMVRARTVYAAQDIRPDHEFVDVFRIDENGVRHIDYSRIHDIRPLAQSTIADP